MPRARLSTSTHPQFELRDVSCPFVVQSELWDFDALSDAEDQQPDSAGESEASCFGPEAPHRLAAAAQSPPPGAHVGIRARVALPDSPLFLPDGRHGGASLQRAVRPGDAEATFRTKLDALFDGSGLSACSRGNSAASATSDGIGDDPPDNLRQELWSKSFHVSPTAAEKSDCRESVGHDSPNGKPALSVTPSFYQEAENPRLRAGRRVPLKQRLAHKAAVVAASRFGIIGASSSRFASTAVESLPGAGPAVEVPLRPKARLTSPEGASVKPTSIASSTPPPMPTLSVLTTSAMSMPVSQQEESMASVAIEIEARGSRVRSAFALVRAAKKAPRSFESGDAVGEAPGAEGANPARTSATTALGSNLPCWETLTGFGVEAACGTDGGMLEPTTQRAMGVQLAVTATPSTSSSRKIASAVAGDVAAAPIHIVRAPERDAPGNVVAAATAGGTTALPHRHGAIFPQIASSCQLDNPSLLDPSAGSMLISMDVRLRALGLA